jgi:hypothetical protein
MADNVAITAGSGTTIAADDVGGVLYQRVKVTWGPDATANDADVATGKPLPVQLRSATGAELRADEYETVAASQTAQTLGATGGTGDYLAGVLVIPATVAPSITVFTGGTNSVSNLVPFFVPLGLTSVSGAWKITTGANVSAIGIGNFT